MEGAAFIKGIEKAMSKKLTYLHPDEIARWVIDGPLDAITPDICRAEMGSSIFRSDRVWLGPHVTNDDEANCRCCIIQAPRILKEEKPIMNRIIARIICFWHGHVISEDQIESDILDLRIRCKRCSP